MYSPEDDFSDIQIMHAKSKIRGLLMGITYQSCGLNFCFKRLFLQNSGYFISAGSGEKSVN